MVFRKPRYCYQSHLTRELAYHEYKFKIATINEQRSYRWQCVWSQTVFTKFDQVNMLQSCVDQTISIQLFNSCTPLCPRQTVNGSEEDGGNQINRHVGRRIDVSYRYEHVNKWLDIFTVETDNSIWKCHRVRRSDR